MIKYEVLYWYNPETQERDRRADPILISNLGLAVH